MSTAQIVLFWIGYAWMVMLATNLVARFWPWNWKGADRTDKAWMDRKKGAK